MIATTGGRGDQVLLGVLEDRLVPRSSAARTTSTFLSNSSASTPIASSESVCVIDAISPSCHQLLDDVGDLHAEVLGDVAHRRAGGDLDRLAARRPRSCRPRPARAAARRGRGCGAGAAAGIGGGACRREACESITTRRRREAVPGRLRDGRRPPAAGRCGPLEARRRPPGRRAPAWARAAAARWADRAAGAVWRRLRALPVSAGCFAAAGFAVAAGAGAVPGGGARVAVRRSVAATAPSAPRPPRRSTQPP